MSVALVTVCSVAVAEDGPHPGQHNVSVAAFDYGVTVGYANELAPRINVAISATFLPTGLRDYWLAGGSLAGRQHWRLNHWSRIFLEIHIRAMYVDATSADGTATMLMAGSAVGWQPFTGGLNLAVGLSGGHVETVGNCERRCIVAHGASLRPLLELGFAF